MRTKNGEHRYVESGLPNVLLVNVPVSTCPKCGTTAVSIPGIEALHRSLAHELADKRERLMPSEIKFLRKWLGYSGLDLAALIGVPAETLSRWESKTTPEPMNTTAERLLRLIVLTREPIAEYPLDKLGEVSARARPARLRLKRNSTGARWKPEGGAPARA